MQPIHAGDLPELLNQEFSVVESVMLRRYGDEGNWNQLRVDLAKALDRSYGDHRNDKARLEGLLYGAKRSAEIWETRCREATDQLIATEVRLDRVRQLVDDDVLCRLVGDGRHEDHECPGLLVRSAMREI